MAKENISVKFLIHLVGERPALWDKTSDDYKDRALKETSWREICTYINENYYSMTQRAKEEFTRMINKKWTHIRDSWVKSMKYGYDEVTKKPPKPYVYHNELKFMQKILKCKPPRYNLNRSQLSNRHFEEFYCDKNETQNSNETANELDKNEEEEEEENDTFAALDAEIEKKVQNDDSKITIVVNKTDNIMEDVDDWNLEDTRLASITGEQQTSKQAVTGKKKRQSIFINSRGEDEEFRMVPTVEPPPVVVRQTMPPVECRRTNLQRLHNILYENRHWNFFKGILPSVNHLDEDHALQFQSGVIGLLQKLRESQKQKSTTKSSRWLSSHSLYKGRGRKRKASCEDDYDDDWATHHNRSTRKRATRHISDPIAPEDKNFESEYSSHN